jgi:hypothetical protein
MGICVLNCFSQTDASATIFNGSGSFTRVMGIQPEIIDGMNRISGLNFATNKKVVGSAFIDEDFHNGYIRFFNDKVIEKIMIKYNNLNNELYFEEDGKELILQTSYKEFGYTVKDEELLRKIIFRNGFPPIENSGAATFYQLLTDQGFLLLKLSTKKVHEMKEPNGMDYLRIMSTESYFVFDSAMNRMVKIKNGVSGIMESMPEQKEKIERICKEQRLKCKSEKEMILLFTQLK